VNEFIVYWDPADTTCSSDLLVAGEPVDPSSLNMKDGISKGAKSTTVDNAVGVGESAAVGVVAVDPAGNESVLSNTACLTGVPTNGFWDEYMASGGMAKSGCSVTRLSRTHVAQWLLMGLALFALWVRARKGLT
jgi:hypothetical protein